MKQAIPFGRLAETEEVAKAEAEGVVRITSSVSFGTTAVEPILPAFFEAYPKVIVDLSLSDEVVDLYLDRTDIAIRVGKLPDSNLIARKIGGGVLICLRHAARLVANWQTEAKSLQECGVAMGY